MQKRTRKINMEILKNKITLIGDVHGKYDKYIDICSRNQYTIQLGDMGYYYLPLMNKTNEYKHKFIGGNHEQWDHISTVPHYLGRYGYAQLNGVSFFFVSGGFSLDYVWRMKNYYSGNGPQTYFSNEELSHKEGIECLKLYQEIRPDLVLTHEAPRCIVGEITNTDLLRNFGFDPKTFKTSTSELFDQMLNIHVPKEWFFGHYHTSKTIVKNGCTFRCLNELETVVLEK